jgi:hypothetical protein
MSENTENTKPVDFPLSPSEEDFQQACKTIRTVEEFEQALDELTPGNSPLAKALTILIGEGVTCFVTQKAETEVDLFNILCQKGMQKDVAERLVMAVVVLLEIETSETKTSDSQQIVQPSLDNGQPFTRAEIWGITKFLVWPVVLVLLGYYFFFAPPDLRCENSKIQTLARKLFVVYFDDISKPQTQTERLMSSYVDSKLKTAMNTSKAKYTSPDRVKFDSIETIKTPDDDAPESTTGSKIQYACSAMARFQLTPALAARLDNNNKMSALLRRHGNEIGIEIIYTTEINSDGDTEVGIKYQHPLMDVVLKTLFRANREEEPKAPENAESPGALGSQQEERPGAPDMERGHDLPRSP